MFGFIERLLRAFTPGNNVDWLGQHPDARMLKRVPVAGGFQLTYGDHTGNYAVYNTDPLGNVIHVDTSTQ